MAAQCEGWRSKEETDHAMRKAKERDGKDSWKTDETHIPM